MPKDNRIGDWKVIMPGRKMFGYVIEQIIKRYKLFVFHTITLGLLLTGFVNPVCILAQVSSQAQMMVIASKALDGLGQPAESTSTEMAPDGTPGPADSTVSEGVPESTGISEPGPDETGQPENNAEPAFVLADNMTVAMAREAQTVRESLQETASQYFVPEPLGFSFETFSELYSDVVNLPMKLPRLIDYIIDQARLLGLIGSLVIILFLSGLIYMLTGQRKVMSYLESIILPLISHLPITIKMYLKLVLKLAAAAMFPGVFWIIYWFVQSFTGLNQPWFLLIGRLMVVWAGGVAGLVALHEFFIGRLIPIPENYGQTIHRITRIIALYIIFTVIIFYCAEAFQIRQEYLALLKVVLYLTVVIASLGLLVKKQAILSLLPDLPYRGYRIFRNTLTRIYTPAMIGTFLTGVLWSFGYRQLCRTIWTRTWAVATVVIAIMLAYHFVSRWIVNRRKKYALDNLSAESYFKALSAGVVFITAVLLLYFVLSLLGIYAPMKRLVSFPIFYIGQTPISFWAGFKVLLTIYIFFQISRILRGYLDFKIFPALGVEEGLAYSINTFIGYMLIIVGILFALHSMGLDLRILMVFAGALGIGVGLGLQSLITNVIAGLSLIFGRRIRKGDWVETGQTMGYVREVSLRATKIVTRDNIEYIVPNSELTAKTIVNYTLTDPLVRVHVPVGVSYQASPEEVQALLLTIAKSYKGIDQGKEPVVMFTDYGESSINFKLLVWIDVRKISDLQVRSDLYFRIFTALGEKGIEIPFPQRDIHIRTDMTRNPSN